LAKLNGEIYCTAILYFYVALLYSCGGGGGDGTSLHFTIGPRLRDVLRFIGCPPSDLKNSWILLFEPPSIVKSWVRPFMRI